MKHIINVIGLPLSACRWSRSYIYLLNTAITSLLYMMENGSSAEMGVAGNDGLVVIALFMGDDTVPN